MFRLFLTKYGTYFEGALVNNYEVISNYTKLTCELEFYDHQQLTPHHIADCV